jgi:hypothetical protein
MGIVRRKRTPGAVSTLLEKAVPLAISTVALVTLVGCESRFRAYSWETGSSTQMKSTTEVEFIPVYWRDAGLFNPPKPALPDRKYTVVGEVIGEANVLSQGLRFELVERELRRGAAALHGDAVIDARRTHFFGPSPAAEFRAEVVRWK